MAAFGAIEPCPHPAPSIGSDQSIYPAAGLAAETGWAEIDRRALLYRLPVIPRCGRVTRQAYHVWGVPGARTSTRWRKRDGPHRPAPEQRRAMMLDASLPREPSGPCGRPCSCAVRARRAVHSAAFDIASTLAISCRSTGSLIFPVARARSRIARISASRGTRDAVAGKLFQAVGVALPPNPSGTPPHPAFPGWYRILRRNSPDYSIGYNMLC
jgi:hypothetical protein